MLTFKLAWRNIWRNTRRTLITSAAIMAALFLALLMRSFQNGMYDQLLDSIVGKFSGYVQVHGENYWEERSIDNTFVSSDSLIATIEGVEGVNQVIPRLETFALSSHKDLTKGVFLQGVIPEKENLLKDFASSIIEGEMFDQKKDQILVTKGVAKFYGLSPGDTLVFIGQGYHGSSAAGKYEISGIVDLKNPNLNKLYVLLGIETMRDFCGGDNITSTLVIDKDPAVSELVLAEALKEKLNPELYEIMTWQEMIPEILQLIQADKAGDLIFIAILYMIISFGIFGTILMMTQERMFEFGVLLSIGMTRLKIMKIVVVESFFLALLGILAAVAFVMPILYYFHYNPINMGEEMSEMMEDYGFSAEIPTSIAWDLPLEHGMIILIITLVLTTYPVLVLRKLNPVKAMKK
jgi:putative ABC transport system permease protein